MSVLILCVSIIFTLVFPLLSLPVNLLGVIFAKGKIKKTYAFLSAFSLAMMAYIFVPDSTMDLYRHHQQLSLFVDFDISRMFGFIQSDFEPLHYFVKFIVAQTGDYNLLQFLIVLIGYFELFFMVADLAELKKMKPWMVGLLLLYVFSSVRFIDFASGLRFNFAIINLALGVYLFFFKKRKYLPYLFFALAVGMHISTLLTAIPILMFSKLKRFRELRISTLLILILLSLMPGLIVTLLANILGTDNGFADMVNKMYNAYFVNGNENFGYLHGGWNLFFPVLNMIIGILVAAYMSKRLANRRYCVFVIYIAAVLLALTVNGGVFMRYGFFVTMLALPVLMDMMTTVKNKRLVLLLVSGIVSLTIVQLARTSLQMDSAGLITEIKNNITNDTLYIVNEVKE
ncbi:hypothetical protein IJG93_01380 [Candidatus Saccharibacteria bacterium]|nr:hypothetical protein [Candidatus Saccharibacteria bacterium]